MKSKAPPQAAYVLHRWDWSESSLVLDLFTREHGRVAVVAKGAKRPYSQLRPVLLPFQRLNVHLGRSAEAEVQLLRGAEWAGGAPMLSGEALFSGFYLNELLMKLLARHDAHPALFDVYADTLPALSGGNELRAQAALRAFELLLLRSIGLLPDLAHVTLRLTATEPRARYALRAESGLVDVAGAEAALSGQAWAGVQAALDAGNLGALQAACLTELQPLRGQLRALLHYHLGSPLLRTREVMRDLQRLTDVSPNAA
ncbi:DNA repair protein RecO [Azohydromonas lata]|uniref:DNA repair protein RecO n=1 Tax=Azohydromonas lata TaxID=45677 RepID=A0ABU5IBU4_9BURK|nr:DNA repair protein RecO [Azohydromonas lata]MDZ5456572.1 DNA repair protein RecO [Azohydromonas lata]